MLVLSRRVREKILFPTYDVSVTVVAARPGRVRLGIEMPAQVPVYREEIWTRTVATIPPMQHLPDSQEPAALQQLNVLVHNRLHMAELGLALLRNQLEAGLESDARSTIEGIAEELLLLKERVEGEVGKATSSMSRPMKALIVEDDHNERELMAGFLRMAGLEVVTADDGLDGLDQLREEARPDFVLLDMLMPRCDGPTMLRTVREDPSLAGLNIFALSSHTPEYFGLDPGAEGIRRWFRKPVDPEAMLRDVGEELGELS